MTVALRLHYAGCSATNCLYVCASNVYLSEIIPQLCIVQKSDTAIYNLHFSWSHKIERVFFMFMNNLPNFVNLRGVAIADFDGAVLKCLLCLYNLLVYGKLLF